METDRILDNDKINIFIFYNLIAALYTGCYLSVVNVAKMTYGKTWSGWSHGAECFYVLDQSLTLQDFGYDYNALEIRSKTHLKSAPKHTTPWLLPTPCFSICPIKLRCHVYFFLFSCGSLDRTTARHKLQ